MANERVVERLNAALHELFVTYERLYLLGEDVSDPYGGAFKATRGLSSRYPERVIATPLSENGIVGVANGLALAGNPVIVEIMFGDFIALAFDQILNFATKSVGMYGRHVAMPLIVRCPVGGNRGYGPTHSQSPQKHFIGVPHLTLCELSAFHDPLDLMRKAFERAEPCILFEDKVLYTQRVHADGVVDGEFRYEQIDGPGDWVRVFRAGAGPAGAILVATGGMAGRALEAIREAHRSGVVVDLLVPAQLYPFEVRPVLPLLASAGRLCVVEESVAGGTWGSNVAAELQDRLWSRLSAPIALVNSRPSVIPAAPHLERAVLVQSEDILAAIMRLVGTGPVDHGRPGRAAASPTAVGPSGYTVSLPRLDANDDSAIIVERLVGDGATVAAGTAVALAETSKAVYEIEVERAGVLRWVREVGEECPFGDVVAYLDGSDAVTARGNALAPAAAADAPPIGAPSRDEAATGARPDGELRGSVAAPADRVQTAVAATVTRSLTIPAAFTAGKVDADAAVRLLDRLSDESGALIDLPSFFVKALGVLRHQYPGLYGIRAEDGTFHPSATADVAVTTDAGAGLFMPVVRDADVRDLADIADDLVEFRMAALEGRFSDGRLSGGAISLSLNIVEGITLVRPLIMAPQVCIVSVGGMDRELRLAPDGSVNEVSVMSVGVTYDHRLINGGHAASFLTALRRLVARPEAVLGGVVECGD